MNAGNREKYQFIEGARGIAALQVTLLHYASSLFPAFARGDNKPMFPWEAQLSHTPVFFLTDGFTAVFIFFLMSGFVLAPSFINGKTGALRQAIKRFIRLYLPVTVAVLFAVIFAFLIPSESTIVASKSHSSWVAWLFHNPLTTRSLSKDIFESSMIFGYAGPSIFSGFVSMKTGIQLAPLDAAMIPPLWTLHSEFWGSMLLIVVARFYGLLSHRFRYIGLAFAVPIFGTSYFILFVLGFAAYLGRASLIRDSRPARTIIGLMLIALGVFIATTASVDPFADALRISQTVTLLHADDAQQLQNEVAAVVLLLGVCLTSSARRLLSSRVPVWLGKISFSVYLLHFPILFTVGFAMFDRFALRVPYVAAAVATTLIGITITIMCAIAFERLVDRSAVKLSKWLTTSGEQPSSKQTV